MKRLKYFVVGVCVMWFVCHVAFLVVKTSTLQLAIMVMFIALLCAFICSVVYAIKMWSALGFKSLILLALCILVVPAAEVVGMFGRDLHFEYLLQPEFVEVIAEVDRAEISRGEPPVILASKYAYLVWAEIAPNGKLHVIFFTDSGFPVKHGGFLYVEGADIDGAASILRSWKRPYPIKDSWYRISD